MWIFNAFTATVWATPLIIGVLMSQWLRRKMRPAGRVVLWVIYFVWGWRWAVLWDWKFSGGSGRYAVENLVFISGVWGTILVGAVPMMWAEAKRLEAGPS